MMMMMKTGWVSNWMITEITVHKNTTYYESERGGASQSKARRERKKKSIVGFIK